MSQCERDESGVWRARVSPTDPVTGKRYWKRVSAPLKRECEDLVRQVFAANAERGRPASSRTLGAYLSEWIASIEGTVRPQTRQRYAREIDLHLVPLVGDIRLDRLTAQHIQSAYGNLLRSGLSPSTVRLAHAVLDRALKDATRRGVVPRNPADHVDLPRKVEPELVVWSLAEARRFDQASEGNRLHALFRLALLGGLRRGELLGLMWQDVNWERSSVSVQRSMSKGESGFVLGETKTRSGRRSVKLPQSCMESLRLHLEEQDRSLGIRRLRPEGFVFTSHLGTPLHPNSLMAEYERVVKDAGVPRIRFHDLRHTSATLLLSSGVHPRVVQERLGHSDISMTLGRYSHVLEDVQQSAADALGRAFGDEGEGEEPAVHRR